MLVMNATLEKSTQCLRIAVSVTVYKFTTNTTMEIFMSNKKLIFSCVKLTSRFLIALHLFGNETQMMSKCSKNKNNGTQAIKHGWQ